MVITHKDVEPTAEQRRQIINSFSPIIANWSANNKGNIDWPKHFDQHFRFYWRELGLQFIRDDAEIGTHVVEWLACRTVSFLRVNSEVHKIGTAPRLTKNGGQKRRRQKQLRISESRRYGRPFSTGNAVSSVAGLEKTRPEVPNPVLSAYR
jgi:hypothetical protein